MSAQSQPDRTHIRMVITRRGVSEILLSRRLSRLSLPWLDVPSGFRLAEQLVSGVLEKYGIVTSCLSVQNVEAAREPRTPHRYAVMEALSQTAEAPPDATWVPFAAAASEATVGLADRAVMAGSIDRLAKPEQGPFAKPGWLEELFLWVRDQIAPLGLGPTGDFHQLNASASFSLIRIETTGEPVWFKATGEPNTHELSLSLALADLFPRHVPRIIAVHSAWNGWLSQHVSRIPLGETTDPFAWERAAEDLAELQISSIGKTAQLLAAGARDLRMGRLAERIDRFLARMAELMALQEKQTPAPLGDDQIERLSEVIKQSCTRLESLGLPHTLAHLDFNLGNIVVGGDHCVFLDWAEGAISNPLLTFEILVEHAVRSGLTEVDIIGRLQNCYLRSWAMLYSPVELRQARELSPLVAIFAYASANCSWLSQDLLDNPQRAGYFRALTRRMYHEAIRVEQGSQSCLTT
jgi:hypothetical protein